MWKTVKLQFTAYKWLIIGSLALAVLLGTNIWSFSQGKSVERASWLSSQAEAVKQQDLEREMLAQMGRLAEQAFFQKDDEIRRAKDARRKRVAEATDGRVCFANWDAVRLWNEALSGSASVPGAAGKPVEGPTGAASVTDRDALDNQVENGARWQACREQVKAIRKLYRQQRGLPEGD